MFFHVSRTIDKSFSDLNAPFPHFLSGKIAIVLPNSNANANFPVKPRPQTQLVAPPLYFRSIVYVCTCAHGHVHMYVHMSLLS